MNSLRPTIRRTFRGTAAATVRRAFRRTFRGTAAATVTLAALLAAGGCTTDSYHTGEGRNSLTQAELVELTTNADKQGVAFVTDDGDRYALSPLLTAKWLQVADTTYRAIVYFKKTAEGKAQVQSSAAVTTVHPIAHWRFKVQPADPVSMESAWVARSGKYLNMALLVKTGYVDDEEPHHAVGLACDTVLRHDNQRRTAYYRLLHDQGEAPLYYTARRYVSVALPATLPDTIRLTYPTASGTEQREFAIK